LQISVCDEYSLPLDFIKKRPSSFDPGLAECLPDNWPSPSSEHVSLCVCVLIKVSLPSPLDAKPKRVLHKVTTFVDDNTKQKSLKLKIVLQSKATQNPLELVVVASNSRNM